MPNILLISEDQSLTKSWSLALSKKYSVTIQNSISNFEKMSGNHSLIILDAELLDSNSVTLRQLASLNAKLLITGVKWPGNKQVEALLSGASGYCDKSIQINLLYRAVESILKGDIWIQRHLIPRVISILVQSNKLNSAKTEPLPTANLESLSSRELDVAKMIRGGESNKTIGTVLNISERTVKAHLTSIFKKLNVPDRLHLAIF